MKTKCLIYCRVSSERQVKEGHGLDTQEKRCRDYAHEKGYIIEKIFREEGLKGELFDRPQMKELIKYLDEHPDHQYVVIFDDLKRFSRDVIVHFKLKSEICGRGSNVESPNFRFEDSPEGRYVETIIVATGELEKNQNKRQVRQKMKARIESGYWSFCQPKGLKFITDPIHGQLLIPIEPYATIFRETAEKYANDSLNSYQEVKQFINDQYKIYGIDETISQNGAQRVLKNPLYAGLVEYRPWNITLRRGKHSGFIPEEVFYKVQEKMFGKVKPTIRNDYNPSFPLRRHLLCSKCQKPMTAGDTQGRGKKIYSYYRCTTKGCIKYGRSINSQQIEQEFEQLLKKTALSEEKIELATAILHEVWNKKEQDYHIYQSNSIHQKQKIEKRIASLIERISATSNQELINLYEEQIIKLNQELKEISVSLKTRQFTPEQFRNAMDMVFQLLKDPVTLWKSDQKVNKQTLLQMYFDQKLIYDKDEGFRNVNIAYPIKLIRSISPNKSRHVEMPGIEPGSANVLLEIEYFL